MHGHVDAGVLAARPALRRPGRPAGRPRPLPAAHARVAGRAAATTLGVAAGDGPARPTRGDLAARSAQHWHLFRGTPTRYWLEHGLRRGLRRDDAARRPTPPTSCSTRSAERLAKPEFRPRALFERFGIEVLATTDSAAVDLRRPRRPARAGLGRPGGADVPPGRAAAPSTGPAGRPTSTQLGELTGVDTGDYAGYLAAMRAAPPRVRRGRARWPPTTATPAPTLTPLTDAEAGADLRRGAGGHGRRGADAAAFAGHMLIEMARMSCEDGLVMQLHPGVLRDHDRGGPRALRARPGLRHPGADRVHPRPAAAAGGFGTGPELPDGRVHCRRDHVLAGAGAARRGVPGDAARRAVVVPRQPRRACAGSARRSPRRPGFYNTAGFVDDTRAFLSIPARHDLARRVDAGYLARLVAEHRWAWTRRSRRRWTWPTTSRRRATPVAPEGRRPGGAPLG